MPGDISAIIASNVRGERAKRRWTQRDLSARLDGITVTVLSDIETGMRKVFAADLLPLCAAFNVPLVKLLDGLDDDDLRTLGLL